MKFSEGQQVIVFPSMGLPYHAKIERLDQADGAVVRRIRDGRKLRAKLCNMRHGERVVTSNGPIERPITHERPEFSEPIEKARPERSDAYLDFVRSFSCCSCRAAPRSQAHHYGPPEEKAAGRKVSDYWTVPLCAACHNEFHSTAAVPRRSMLETKVLFREAQSRLLVRWIRANLQEKE